MGSCDLFEDEILISSWYLLIFDPTPARPLTQKGIPMSESIQNGKVIQLAYTLTNAAGDVLDRSDKADPFMYLHGAGQIVPGLETGLEGCKVGDKKKVVVPPGAGYGEVDPELKMSVKRTQFPPTVEMEAGMQFESRSPDGQGMIFTIESIEGDQVHIDGNHPLAGQTLHFDVEVLTVRDATEEEQEHGHAHGEGGHGHGHDHDHEHGEDCDHDHAEEEDDDGHQHTH
jgi:FKBP-type peptidyl-prolyl cis-trans isomerase SlyD